MQMRIIIYEGEKGLVAQCLEKDIVSTNDSENVLGLLADLNLQIALNEDTNLPSAPKEFHDMWEAAEDIIVDSPHNFSFRKVA